MTNASTAFIASSSTHEGNSPARPLATMRIATMQPAVPDDRTVAQSTGARTYRLPTVRSICIVFGLLVVSGRGRARLSIATLYCRHPRNETIRRGRRRARCKLVGCRRGAMEFGRVATPGGVGFEDFTLHEEGIGIEHGMVAHRHAVMGERGGA